MDRDHGRQGSGPTLRGKSFEEFLEGNEIYTFFNEEDVVLTRKLGRLSWAGHLARMGNPKLVLVERLHGKLIRERPKVSGEKV